LAVEGALNVSCVLEDLPRVFEVLVHILLFNNCMPFLLGRDFFSASTAKLHKFATSSTQRVGPLVWTFGLSYATGNLIEKVGRRNRTDERGEYVCWKSVESLRMEISERDMINSEKGEISKTYPCEEKDVFGFPLKVRIIC
jgi:hypothetical protein